MKPFVILSSLILASCGKPTFDTSTSASSSKKTTQDIQYHALSDANTTLHYIAFSANDFSIEVADQPDGPGSQWIDAKAAAKAHNALAAINAGFFTPEGKPLGICVDDGEKTGYLNPSSLGSGAYVLPAKGKPKLIRRSLISQIKNPQHLLQSGPFLIENKKPISVKDSEARPRSFIAWNGNDKWIIGHVESISLPQLVKLLHSAKIPNFSLHTALNLDGGRSCEFYMDSSISGKEKQIRTFMNRKVRNFLVVKKK